LTGCYFFFSVLTVRTLFFAFASLFVCSAQSVSKVLITDVLLDLIDRGFTTADLRFGFLGPGFGQGSGCESEGTR